MKEQPQEELVEALMSDFWKNCKHGLTFELKDPYDDEILEVCKVCGEEVLK